MKSVIQTILDNELNIYDAVCGNPDYFPAIHRRERMYHILYRQLPRKALPILKGYADVSLAVLAMEVDSAFAEGVKLGARLMSELNRV